MAERRVMKVSISFSRQREVFSRAVDRIRITAKLAKIRLGIHMTIPIGKPDVSAADLAKVWRI